MLFFVVFFLSMRSALMYIVVKYPNVVKKTTHCKSTILLYFNKCRFSSRFPRFNNANALLIGSMVITDFIYSNVIECMY